MNYYYIFIISSSSGNSSTSSTNSSSIQINNTKMPTKPFESMRKSANLDSGVVFHPGCAVLQAELERRCGSRATHWNMHTRPGHRTEGRLVSISET